MGHLTIKHVRAFVLRGGGAITTTRPTATGSTITYSTPIKQIPEYRQSRRSFGINVLGTLVRWRSKPATALSGLP